MSRLHHTQVTLTTGCTIQGAQGSLLKKCEAFHMSVLCEQIRWKHFLMLPHCSASMQLHNASFTAPATSSSIQTQLVLCETKLKRTYKRLADQEPLAQHMKNLSDTAQRVTTLCIKSSESPSFFSTSFILFLDILSSDYFSVFSCRLHRAESALKKGLAVRLSRNQDNYFVIGYYPSPR